MKITENQLWEDIENGKYEVAYRENRDKKILLYVIDFHKLEHFSAVIENDIAEISNLNGADNKLEEEEIATIFANLN